MLSYGSYNLFTANEDIKKINSTLNQVIKIKMQPINQKIVAINGILAIINISKFKKLGN